MRTIGKLFSTCLAVLAVAFAGSAAAAVITYEATDLADNVPGEDRWQYAYRVTGSFVKDGGFQILFPASDYGLIEGTFPAVVGDWDVNVSQPDPIFLFDGIYGATAQAAKNALAELFTVSFIWLGSGTPGAQTYEVFDESFFPLIETGSTRPQAAAAPAPGTLVLLGLGLIGFAACHRGSRRAEGGAAAAT